MSKRDDTQLRAALDDLFVDGALPDDVDARALYEHLGADADARDHYDRLALASRALEGAPEERSTIERDFARDSFMGALDDLLASEPDAAPHHHAEEEHHAPVITLWDRVRLNAPHAAAAAIIFAVGGSFILNSTPTPQPADSGTFTPRKAVTDTDPIQSQRAVQAPDIEVYCVERQGGEVVFTGADEAPFGTLLCPQDAEIKLAYQRPGDGLEHVAMFGVDASGNLLWYGPSPAAPEPVFAGDEPGMNAFGETVRLHVNHAPGPHRVHAIFSRDAIDFPTLERMLRGRDDLFASEQLTDIGGVATSKTFEVAGGSP